MHMDDLIYNYVAFFEVVFTAEEILPEVVFQKYGLISLTPKEIRQLEALEMRRLQRENMTLNEIGKRFKMSDSGVCRRIKRWL